MATKLIFVHIPKAAGTTLNRFIEAQYSPSRIYTIGGYKPSEHIKKFVQFSEFRKNFYSVYKGHGAWALTNNLPSPFQAITILRDPISKAISTYNYTKSNPKHRNYKEANRLSFSDYIIGLEESTFQNPQVRELCSKSTQYDSDISYSDLVEAKKNIETYFSVVGVTELFNESVALMCLKLGWTPHGIVTENVTPSSQASQISIEDRRKLEDQLKLDIELYQWAKSRLDETLCQYSEEISSIVKILETPSNTSPLNTKIRAAISRLVSY